jgi:hypothetical protein
MITSRDPKTGQIIASYGEKIHGHSSPRTPSYRSWTAMHGRCYRSRNASFAHYGERGIQVCARWFDFQNFLQDMGERPRGTTLHRTNNDGHYMPSNCKWATTAEQARNRRKSVTSVDRRIGEQYGRLLIVGVDSYADDARSAKMFCVCSCGNKLSVRLNHLRSGATRSCGCLRREIGRERMKFQR